MNKEFLHKANDIIKYLLRNLTWVNLFLEDLIEKFDENKENDLEEIFDAIKDRIFFIGKYMELISCLDSAFNGKFLGIETIYKEKTC